MALFNSLPVLSFRDSAMIPFAAGLLVYFVYKKFEIHPSSPYSTIFLLFDVPLASSLFLFQYYSAGFAVLAGFSVFYSTLLSSIVLYRISPWHPLARYPGPFTAKISQFWLAYETATGRWHETLKDLHAKHGPYVRIGPNQLSFIDASLIPKIMGPDGMPKGPMFDGARMPGVPANIVATRDLADHAQLRKPWSKGFSSAAVKEYTPTIERRALQLAEELEKFTIKKGNDARSPRSVDLAMWLSRFAFDFMGDMAFGGAFELMKDGDTSGIWGMIGKQMLAQATLHRLPWSVHIVHSLPYVVAAMVTFTTFVNNCIFERVQRGARNKDLFYHLANEDIEGSCQSAHDKTLLSENCKVAIIAGSDTTATTISHIFYYLLSNPSVLGRLRKELDGAFPLGEGDPFDFTRLAELPVLNAVINETLRLQPPVPTDLQRAPAAGSRYKQIGEHIIPEGTAVNVPPYVLHRQARYFSPIPETFWIDRWLQPSPTTESDSKSKMHFVHDTSAYMPFSYGPANCAGKMLALAEIRSVTALLLQRFEISFAHGYDKDQWEKDMKNHFVFRLGELPVVLTSRNQI
ncbi:high nitrogen upregulated cytochrome P450 monooxygenase 1 [Fomitiporia mediterranea MF3/22]|uniref:high nitrogen upregulated cytochrome P450 monooxygenase 1 n=1 Tax=Fomitiporia mediterranea (strain MF3/22) TaxID=694068 RepID=UPI0004409181|nr:high nitrogen upregulated cytochrome P450 monooxygenase 1 [Fomitiporia mediterranea MF3/22]EJD01754.1 high nitrogen upregulated cytochrome P450 monooxygenase 1 [Fomitiporia mediterranea MF3/22]